MKVVLIDHYDSFVYNIVHAVEGLGYPVQIMRCDVIDFNSIAADPPSHIIFSPGPCGPLETGQTLDLIRAQLGQIPILGICLGAQALAYALGGQVVSAYQPRHGYAVQIFHEHSELFDQIQNPMTVGLYHSLMIDAATLPSVFKITARCENHQVMAIEHHDARAYGFQFHPESILTPMGTQLFKNFLSNPQGQYGNI